MSKHIYGLKSALIFGFSTLSSVTALAIDWKYSESIISGSNVVMRQAILQARDSTKVSEFTDRIALPMLSITCTSDGSKSLLFIPGDPIKIQESKVSFHYVGEDNQFKKIDANMDFVGNKSGVILYGAQAMDMITNIKKSDHLFIQFKYDKKKSGDSLFSNLKGLESAAKKLFEKCDL